MFTLLSKNSDASAVQQAEAHLKLVYIYIYKYVYIYIYIIVFLTVCTPIPLQFMCIGLLPQVEMFTLLSKNSDASAVQQAEAHLKLAFACLDGIGVDPSQEIATNHVRNVIRLSRGYANLYMYITFRASYT